MPVPAEADSDALAIGSEASACASFNSSALSGDIALKQAVKVTDGWLERSVNDGIPSGRVTLSGRAFERFLADSAGQVSYVVRGAGGGGLTIVATGTAPEDELKAFAAALRPVTPTR